ncbi:MAG: hypothetical protein KatS3mg016_1358 [Fimbriimonadales bacterium]|nr:MAG: hypothetical protein KatS3mg016_1358 [Fimbriimonadales bacterium]
MSAHGSMTPAQAGGCSATQSTRLQATRTCIGMQGMIPPIVGMTAIKDRKSSLKHSRARHNPKPSKLPKEYHPALRYVQAAMALDLCVTKGFTFFLPVYFLLNIPYCFVMNVAGQDIARLVVGQVHQRIKQILYSQTVWEQNPLRISKRRLMSAATNMVVTPVGLKIQVQQAETG